jgi:hypothetical protein
MGVSSTINLIPNSNNINCSENNYEQLINGLEILNFKISEKNLNKFRFEYETNINSRFSGIVRIKKTSIKVLSGYSRNQNLGTKYDEKDDLPFQKEYNEDLEILRYLNKEFSHYLIKIYDIHILNETYKRCYSTWHAE